MDPQRIIERERRWALPTAIAAILGALLVLASLVMQEGANVPTTGPTTEQLRSFHDHAGALVGSGVLGAIGLLLILAPLLYLYNAARGRNPRRRDPSGARGAVGVASWIAVFVVLGPVLSAAQSVVGAAAGATVASDFVSAPPVPEASYRAFQTELSKQPDSIHKITLYPNSDALDVEHTDGTFTFTNYPTNDESKIKAEIDKQKVSSDSSSDGGPGDAYAQKLIQDSTGETISTILLFAGSLFMVVALIEVPLQAMRVGLLRRGVAALGMALGVAFILLGKFGLVANMLWFLYLGLLVVGVAPGGRPPAWDAGISIPWPPPGEEPASPATGAPAVEGEATEVVAGDGERPARRERAKKRKRKRRS